MTLFLLIVIIFLAYLAREKLLWILAGADVLIKTILRPVTCRLGKTRTLLALIIAIAVETLICLIWLNVLTVFILLALSGLFVYVLRADEKD